MLRPAKLTKIYCIFPKKFTWSVLSKLQDIGILHISRSKPTNGFKPMPMPDGKYDKLVELLGATNYLIKLIESRTFKPFVTSLFGPRYIYIAYEMEFNIKKIEKTLKNLRKKYKKLKYEKMAINMSDYNQLLLYRDLLSDKIEQYKALQLFSESKYLIRFDGWVESDKVHRVKNAVEITTKKACVFNVSKKRLENPPTLLKNPSLVKPFEIFIENYGMPGYREIDPTPIIAFTFTFIFGLMFADVGYGLSLFLLSLSVYLMTTKESNFRKNLNLMLIYLGLASMLMGFFFGEFFGLQFRKGAIDPVSDLFMFFMISILVGLIHTSVALLTRMLVNIKDKKDVLFAISMLFVMWSAFSLYYIRDILLNKILLVIGILLLFASKKFGLFKEIASLFAGMFSYLRIAILGFGHVIINRLLISSYHNLSGSLLELGLFIILFVTGSSIVLTLGLFMTILQDVRLHWVEFFPKFFVGKGIKFQPFKRRIAV